jgi:hypothetical protein
LDIEIHISSFIVTNEDVDLSFVLHHHTIFFFFFIFVIDNRFTANAEEKDKLEALDKHVWNLSIYV